MNGRERGFLLLTGQLGNPDRKPMTVAQFRTLAMRVTQSEASRQERALSVDDLLALGYSRQSASDILRLLSEEDVLEYYLQRGAQQQCYPLTRVNPAYPLALRKRLGLDAPGSLWIKGDAALLDTPMVALVGSRRLNDENLRFAETVGTEAARQNLTLVSGNAKGADIVAQEACLAAGGKVVSVVADCLAEHMLRPNITYISELGYDLPFSNPRALSRNRIIHALGYITIVAQSNLGFGGTWDGTVRNLKRSWSPVFCFDDGSPAAKELEQMGATLIDVSRLSDFTSLHFDTPCLFK